MVQWRGKSGCDSHKKWSNKRGQITATCLGGTTFGISLLREGYENRSDLRGMSICEVAIDSILVAAGGRVAKALFPNKGGAYPGPWNRSNPGWFDSGGNFRTSVFTGQHAQRHYKSGAVASPFEIGAALSLASWDKVVGGGSGTPYC